MCFLKHKDHKEVKIAEKNIVCFKVLEKRSIYPDYRELFWNSPYQSLTYFKSKEERKGRTKEMARTMG